MLITSMMTSIKPCFYSFRGAYSVFQFNITITRQLTFNLARALFTEFHIKQHFDRRGLAKSSFILSIASINLLTLADNINTQKTT